MRPAAILFLSIGLLLSIQSCKDGSRAKPISGSTVSSSEADPLFGAVIKNDIRLQAKGIKVTGAYLMDESETILDKNEIPLGKKIYIVIQADTGWTKVDGKTFLGASEQVKIDGTDQVVLNADDLFKDFEGTGFDPELSKLVNLNAVITQASPNANSFTSTFRVWDKKGPGEITGSYSFRLKK